MADANQLIGLKDQLHKLRKRIEKDYEAQTKEIDEALKLIYSELKSKCEHSWKREAYPYAPLMCIKCGVEKP
jgi:hypothetical protein